MLKKIVICILLIGQIGCTTLKFGKHDQPYFPPLPSYSNINLALVLGGGGAKGMAHVGVIEELEKAGIKPDMIVGASAGAMVGALYADDLNIYRIKEVTRKIKLSDIVDFSPAYLPFGFSNGMRTEQFLHKNLKARRFNQLKIPFIAVATNLEFGEDTSFGQGPLIPAIRASAAYPGAFLPIKINDQYFVDGGVANPVPVSVAKRYNPKIIIAVDIKEDLSEEQPTNILGIMVRSLEIAYIHQSNLTAQQADILIQFEFRDVGTFTDANIEELYQAGREKAIQAIPEIKKLMAKRGLV